MFMKINSAIPLNFPVLYWLPFFLFMGSCIPLKIAPNIEGAKVYKGKKFKKYLPKQQVYVFKDPKNENEFYNFINAKFDLDYDIFGGNLPLVIDGKDYLLSFYEVERSTKVVNLAPIAVDVLLEGKGHDPYLAETEIYRAGTWYIALTVSDNNFGDMLKEDNPQFRNIIKYLDNLRNEYLYTANYLEVYLKNPQG